MKTERKEPRNRKDDDDDDQQRIAEGLEHLADGIGDIVGGVIGDPGLHARPAGRAVWPPSPFAPA